MSRRIVVGALFVGLLGVGGWAVYKVEQSRESLRKAMAADVADEPSRPAPAPPSAPAASGGSPNHPANRPAVRDPKPAPPPPDPGPLRSGEILEFSANVAELNNVATLRLETASRDDFRGKLAWHLRAFVHTQNPLRMVFELDDRFDSYSDAAALTSLQYEMHLSERGQKVDSVQRMTVTGGEPASPGASETHVLPGTRDPLGMMQFLRTVDWSKTSEVHGPVYDGHKLYEVRARPRGAQSVTVPAGTFNASPIDIRVFSNGEEMKDAKFTLYLAKDGTRTPVLLEAVLPCATARVELLKAHGAH